ncbi:MAG: hypothetical protein K2X87_09295 [Gemmataceae bacterium]|nr:hypothetical protein [Gemmataceae bacterium]
MRNRELLQAVVDTLDLIDWRVESDGLYTFQVQKLTTIAAAQLQADPVGVGRRVLAEVRTNLLERFDAMAKRLSELEGK